MAMILSDLLSPRRRVELFGAPDLHRTAATKKDSRLWFDRGPIAPRSGLIWHGIEAMINAKSGAMKPPKGIAPTTPSNLSTTASIGHDFWAKIPFKSDVFSILVLQLLIDS